MFTTDGQLLGGKFKLLEDPKHVFGFQNVAPIVKKSVLSAEGPAFEETVNKVSKLLTIPAIQQMNKAVSVEKQAPKTVAEQFLKANGLDLDADRRRAPRLLRSSRGCGAATVDGARCACAVAPRPRAAR